MYIHLPNRFLLVFLRRALIKLNTSDLMKKRQVLLNSSSVLYKIIINVIYFKFSNKLKLIIYNTIGGYFMAFVVGVLFNEQSPSSKVCINDKLSDQLRRFFTLNGT